MAVDVISELLKRNLGECGCWQVCSVILIYASKFAVGWHQILVVISQPPAQFTCSNSSIDKCSPDCPSHKFDRSIFEETVVTQWDLVCGNAWIANLIQTFVMLGILFGNTGFGVLSDRYGRRGPLVWIIVMQIVTGCLAAFAPWLWLYILLRFLSTVATGGTMLISFVLLMEITVQRFRTSVGVFFQLPFQLGHATLGLIGYLCRHWQTQQLVISLPQVLLLSYYCLLPESPRWLLTMGRVDDAVKTIRRAAHCNQRPTEDIKQDVEATAASIAASHVKGGNMWDLVSTPRMRLKTLCQSVNWFVIALDFFGMAQYIGHIGGNIFLNITVAGLIQLPGNFIAIIFMDVCGRKAALIMSYIVCFVPCFIIAALPAEPEWPTQVLSCIGMLGISMSFSVIYVYSSEMFPTVIRNVAMGILSMIARFGSMISPHITYLKEFVTWLPPLILGLFPVISSLITFFFLPETNKQKLPDTIEDANEL